MAAEYPPDHGWMPELRPEGSFYVAGPTERQPPSLLTIDGTQWFRFMDRIYCPSPVFELSVTLVAELCELRLALADEVIDESAHHAVLMTVIAAAAAERDRPRSILDFGTGDGRSIPAIRDRFGAASIIGCDMSRPSLRAAYDHEAVLVQIAPHGPLPFADRSFDLVLSVFVFHFAVPAAVLRELARVISTSGRLVCTVYGGAVARHRMAMTLIGYRQTSSTPVPDAVGHWVDVWSPPPRAATAT